ncbi:MAG: sulfotransferase [Phycisphaerales bacterium]|nr:sulfotransferase [Phycisphaerales bacterium]
MALNQQQLKKLHGTLSNINLALEAGKSTAALKKLNELDRLHPFEPMILTLLAKANSKMGRHNECIDAFARAITVDPKEGTLRHHYALALQRGGRYEDSLVEYERALYYSPKNFQAMRHKCSVLIDLDRINDATKAYSDLQQVVAKIEIDPAQRLAIAITGARLAPKARDAQEAIDELNHGLEAGSLAEEFITSAYWQIGRLQDHLKDYDAAFIAYRTSKEIKKEGWDPETHSQLTDQLIECWTNNADIPFSTIDGSGLIFILGMMRSGTSLTEQMLAQVSCITPGGEMNAIARQVSPIERTTMKHNQAMPKTRALYTKPMIQKMAREAKKMYDQVPHDQILTDKQPYNYTYAPLIAHMFPGCKIIHCVRDPMDCCLSNYTQAFSRPHMQTHDLYWLGRYFRDYERLMQAWHTLPEVDMIDLHYEKLVAEPEAESKRVLDFLGLVWTPDMLNFHESSRTIRTASREQVRKPMYTSSVQKYKRYESHLDELKRGLGIND